MSFPPINRVPQELLIMIFEHVIEADRRSFAYTMDGGWAREAYRKARGVVRLTHVCHRWRRTALDTPTLWNRIDGRCPERLEAYLERARGVPVSLYMNVQPDDLETSLRTVPAEQLRRLDLGVRPMEKYLGPLTTWSAPNLECLTMDDLQDEYRIRTRPLARVELLDGKADALKALALKFMGSWVPSNSFPSLTHLYLSFALTTDAQTHDLLSVLTNTPNLEFLVIEQQLCRLDDVSSIPGPVFLRRLKTLALACIAYTRVMNLLRYLSLPELCFVRCHDVDINPEYDEGAPGPLVDIGPLRHATRLSLGPAVSCEFLLVVESEASGFSMWAHMDDGESTWDSWFHGLPEMITLSTITSLHITIDATHTFWSPVLRHMTATTELKAVITGRYHGYPLPIDTFCALLSEEPVLLPSLRDLYVQGIRCTSNTALTTLSSELVDAVAFRARAGHRLRLLVIQPDPSSESPLPHNPFDERGAELAGLVDRLDVLGPGSAPCRFEVRDSWQVDGADKYWRQGDAHLEILRIDYM